MSEAQEFGLVIGAAILILLLSWGWRRTALKGLEPLYGWLAALALATLTALLLSFCFGMRRDQIWVYPATGFGMFVFVLYGFGGFRVVTFVASKFVRRKYAVLLGGLLPAGVSIPTLVLIPAGVASVVMMVRELGRLPDHGARSQRPTEAQ
jgi:hypothetical protein